MGNDSKIQKLRGTSNYDVQSTLIESYIGAENLTEILSLEGPVDQFSSSQKVKNQKGLFILKSHYEKGPLIYIKNALTTYEAWKSLKSLYNKKGFTDLYILLKRFFKLKS